MTLSPAVFAKAIFAFFVAFIGAASVKAGGADLSVLSAGDWLVALGTGLVSGGGTFAIPNKSAKPELAPTEVITNAVQTVVEAKAQAQADLDKVAQVLNDAAGALPIYSQEAKDLLASLPKF